MYKSDFNILVSSIKLVENKVNRDFIEIGNLQNSSLSVAFVNKTLEFLQNKFYNFFLEKKPSYSLFIKNYKNNVVGNSKYKIIVNSISGIKNYLHAIPYFCTTISILEEERVIMGLVHNYTTNEMFYSIRGEGSFLNNQRIRVSNKNENLLVAVKYDLDRKIFSNILKKLPMFKVNNCSILDCCYTAYGRYDASILLDSDINDLCLGKLIIEESGGLSKKINDNSYLFSNGICTSTIEKILFS